MVMKTFESNRLTTLWGESLDRNLPLNEYPRPDLVRQDWLNLNGIWEYAVAGTDAGEVFPETAGGEILVPFSLETSLSGVERPLSPEERLWYRRSFTVPREWSGRKILLNFEAVDWKCRCYINGSPAGSHTGGYIPFSFDITSLLVPGENRLELIVEDPSDAGLQQRGKQVLEPGYIYYRATSGIWQTVWLEPAASENHITSISCIPEPDLTAFRINIGCFEEGEVEVLLFEGDTPGGSVRGKSSEALVLPVSDPRLWSQENPFLYALKIRLFNSSGYLLEEVSSYAGMRSISRSTGSDGHDRFCLNGTPLFLHGPLDQGYWPESGMTAPSDGALIFDIQRMKDLGFNMIRKHIKVESRRWYYHADRLGMTVIQDMVSGGKNRAEPAALYVLGVLGKREHDTSHRDYKKSGRERAENRKFFREELTQMIHLLISHPSIVCWVPFNESWGQFDALKMEELTRSLDPSRLVDHASGWIDQGGGDFSSIHRYRVKLQKKKRGEKRIHMLSEYGGYNLNVPGHMWDENAKFGYGSYKTKGEYEAALEKLFNRQLIPLIPKGLAAAVYTQLSDVEIESNGFFTYDRKILKCREGFIKELNKRIYRVFEETIG